MLVDCESSVIRVWVDIWMVQFQTCMHLSSNAATSENKTIHTPPPPFKAKVFVGLSISSSNGGTTLLGRDGGGKALFNFLFLISKMLESPFMAKCLK